MTAAVLGYITPHKWGMYTYDNTQYWGP